MEAPPQGQADLLRGDVQATKAILNRTALLSFKGLQRGFQALVEAQQRLTKFRHDARHVRPGRPVRQLVVSLDNPVRRSIHLGTFTIFMYIVVLVVTEFINKPMLLTLFRIHA